MPPYAAGCRILRSSPRSNLSRAFQNEILHSAKRGKMRQIEAAKSSRKVVKRGFSTTPNLCPKDTISRAFRAIKIPATFAAGVKFTIHLSCPEHSLVHLRLFLLVHQFFLLLPGVFQLLHPSHFLNRVLQTKILNRFVSLSVFIRLFHDAFWFFRIGIYAPGAGDRCQRCCIFTLSHKYLR